MMNAQELMETLKQGVNTQFQLSHCIVNGEILKLEDVESAGYSRFLNYAIAKLPIKLYKYFPNFVDAKTGKNYSLEALKDNMVYMQSPQNFDDVYDSEISLDFYTFHKFRLFEYCKRCGLSIGEDQSIETLGNAFTKHIYDSYNEYHDLEHFFIKDSASELEKLSNQQFELKLKIEWSNEKGLTEAISYIINQEYKEYMDQLKTTFRVSCFTTSPYSQLMWSSYADCHRGFCVEYTFSKDPEFDDVEKNLFPVVYCMVRRDLTKYFAESKDKEVTIENLWELCLNGVLRKSIDWAYQNEWRLFVPRGYAVNDKLKFFPITKVFLGNRISAEKKREIMDICVEKNIPYVGVIRNPNLFQMQECAFDCRTCGSFQQRENSLRRKNAEFAKND